MVVSGIERRVVIRDSDPRQTQKEKAVGFLFGAGTPTAGCSIAIYWPTRPPSFERHPRGDHLLVFIELGEDQATVGGDVFARLEPGLHDDVIITFLGDDELPPLELQDVVGILGLTRLFLNKSILIAVHDDHGQPGDHRLARFRRNFQGRPYEHGGFEFAVDVGDRGPDLDGTGIFRHLVGDVLDLADEVLSR